MNKFLSIACASMLMPLAACTSTTPLTVGSNALPAALPPYAFVTLNNEQVFLDSVNDKVFFAFNQSHLRPSAKHVLDTQIAWLNAHQGVKVLIAGNADPRGTRSYNYRLAERRAEATTQYLVNHGIEPSRITMVSYGKDCPIAVGHSRADYAMDRNTITSVDGYNPQANCQR